MDNFSSRKSVPVGWQPVGRDGEFILYASPDLKQGILIDRDTGQPTGNPQPLQIFFKWGNFEAIESSEEIE